MKITRRFTHSNQDPYDEFSFVGRKSEIRNPDGSVIFSCDNVRVPSEWSQIATDVLAQKYFRKAGIPTKTKTISEEGIPQWLSRSEPTDTAEQTSETDARRVFRRLAGTWTYWGVKFDYFDSEQDSRAFYDELRFMLANQMAAPNSPQWFNTGLHWAYGLTGNAQGHWFVDANYGVAVKSNDSYTRPQISACFIQSVSDSLIGDDGIMSLWRREARLFKFGSGSGTNFSDIRGENELLSGGGQSSGLMSFLAIGDRAAGAIKSGGKTRRAAKMVCVDLDHPDIEQFIEWKVIEEQKVAALVAGSKQIERVLKSVLAACKIENISEQHRFNPKKNKLLAKAIKEAITAQCPQNYILRVLQLAKQGFVDLDFETYDTSWTSEAYKTVGGQNSNNSVRIPNSFFDRLDQNEDWELIYRTTGEVAKQFPASELWDKIAYSAWSCADPGLQFDTTINEWHTCKEDGKINASNPCSEFLFLDNSACNLASLNLLRFQTKQGFAIDDFKHAVRLWTIVLDISTEMGQYPTRKIAQNSYDFRPLGLGFANLGALLMSNGLPYDSEKAAAWTAAISAILTGEAYLTSAQMAQEQMPFVKYEPNREHILRVIRNHRRAAYNAKPEEYEGLSITPKGINPKYCPPKMLQAAKNAWDQALLAGEQHGYRNAQVSVIAPTGTIGLVMDCDTTGIEPDFALVKFKKLAGGGYLKIINQGVPNTLTKLGYSKAAANKIVQFAIGKQTLENAPYINHKSLKARGFNDKILAKLEDALASAFNISFAFNSYTLGKAFCQETLGFTQQQLADSSFSMLSALGFSKAEINTANAYCAGTMTLEGSDLKKEHLPIFDCANKCGATGTRYISPFGHIRIMAAAQPFVSGAISKTINMANDATIEQVKEVYRESWQQMLKAITVYRDGSKLSQPLNSMIDSDELLQEITEPEEKQPNKLSPAERVVHRYISKRRRLPNRRGGYTQKAQIGNHKIYLRTGEYEDGTIGEIFIDMHREGAAFRSVLNCFAIAVSLGLQYGVPIEEFVDAFVFTQFKPNGIIHGHDHIKLSTSVIDYIFRELGLTYLGRNELVQVKPEMLYSEDSPVKDDIKDSSDYSVPYELGNNGRRKNRSSGRGFQRQAESTSQTQPFTPIEDPSYEKEEMEKACIHCEDDEENSTNDLDNFGLSNVSVAREKGYEGDPCENCGNFTMVRNGTCTKCATCGSTSGCS